MGAALPETFHAPADAPGGPQLVPAVELEPPPSRWWKLRVGALLVAGYVYLGGVLLGLVAAGLALLFLHAWFVSLAFFGLAFGLGRLLRVEDEVPEGLPVDELNAPLLEETVEHVRSAVGARRPTRVLLGFEDTASVAEVGRLGVLRRNDVYVTIGIPMLLALSPGELEAVVAHELAHASRRHGRWSLWLWNGLERWQRVVTKLDREEHWARVLVRPFFGFYFPRLQRSALRFKRGHEHEADRIAAELVGTERFAQALTRTMLTPALVGRVWDEIHARAVDEELPPEAFELLAQALAGRAVEDAEPVLRDALLHEEPSTHPTLAQRLAALGVPTLPAGAAAPPRETAAHALLGDAYGPVLAAATERWRGAVAEWWAARHRQAGEARARLAELAGEQGQEALLEQAELLDFVSGHAAARDTCERILEAEPDQPFALFVTGAALLEDGDDRGLERLRRAAELEPDAVFPSTALARPFLVRAERFVEAEDWRRFAEGYAYVRALADEERALVRRDDEVVAHGLPDEVVRDVAQALQRFRLKRAYLVRKQLELLNDHDPQWIVGIERRRRHFRFERKDAAEHDVHAVVEALAPIVGARLWVIAGGDYHGLFWRMSRIPGALVLGRERATTRLRRPLSVLNVVAVLVGFFVLFFVFLAAVGRS